MSRCERLARRPARAEPRTTPGTPAAAAGPVARVLVQRAQALERQAHEAAHRASRRAPRPAAAGRPPAPASYSPRASSGAAQVLEVRVAEQVAQLHVRDARLPACRRATPRAAAASPRYSCDDFSRSTSASALAPVSASTSARLPAGQRQRPRARRRRPGAAARTRLGDHHRAPVAAQRAGGVADVGRRRVALHVAHAHERARQLLLQADVAGGLPGQAFQVLDRLLHDQLARRRRARHVVDRVVDLEHERARELADVVEAALGARPARRWPAPPATAPRRRRR